MIINNELLTKLENLSTIKIDDNKKENIKNELSDILNFVENLNKVDIKEHTNTNKNYTPLREDEPILADISDHILNNAPKTNDRFFIVPKIVE